MDMLLELTGSKQDPVIRRLVEAALHHGESLLLMTVFQRLPIHDEHGVG